MIKLYLPFFLSIILQTNQLETVQISSSFFKSDLFSNCQEIENQKTSLFNSLFQNKNSALQIKTEFNKTLNNQSVCNLSINENLNTYTNAIQEQIQIEHQIGTLKLREAIGIQVNETFLLKTHYHFLIFIDTDEKKVKDVKVESNQADYVELQQTDLVIYYTIQYIDIADSDNEPFAYVGYILVQEITYFMCFSFLFLGILLTIISTVLLKNKFGYQKKGSRDEDSTPDEDNFIESNGSLINFELFITYEELVIGICIISNGFQLIQFFVMINLFFTFTDFDTISQDYESTMLTVYLACSIWNGASIWWALVQLKRTLYRKSKLLWQSCKAALLYPVIILIFKKSIFPLIVIEIVQAFGIILGMAIGASFIHDGFGEHKQLFYADAELSPQLSYRPNFKMVKQVFIYGLIPYLCVYILLNEQLNFLIGNSFLSMGSHYLLLILSYTLIIFSITLLVTMSDARYCKTTWSRISTEIALYIQLLADSAPLFWIIIHQIAFFVRNLGQIQTSIQYIFVCFIINLIMFYITGAVSLISSIVIQKHMQIYIKLE